MWIRTIVDNGFVDVTKADKTYVPTVTIGGAVVYNNGGASLTHYAHTRWTVERWIGGDPQITPKLDTAYLINTKLVPKYWNLNPSSAALDALYQSYVPMQKGDWTADMGDTGYQRQIGLLPLWDALYVTSSADSRAYNSVIANAKSLYSYPIIWSDSADGLPTRPSQRPSWTVSGPNGGGATGYGAGSLTWDVAHHGSGGYLAYLITGDYLYLETMQHQSSMCYLMNASSAGSGTSRAMLGQTRGAAWCNRTIGELAGIGPSDSVTNDYASLLANNAVYWNQLRQLSGQNPLGALYSYEAYDNSYGAGRMAPWQQDFFTQAYGFVSDLEPLADMATFNTVRDWMYRFAVGRLGGNGTDSYCFTEAGQYTIKVADALISNPSNTTSFYTSWGTVFEQTLGFPNNSCGNTLHGSSGGDPASAATGYWGNLLPAIAYAVDHGAGGASESWARLTSASNWVTVEQSGFNNTPIWGIVPRSDSSGTTPPPSTTPPLAPSNLTLK